MTFIPLSTQLLQAIKADNAHQVEELISNCDSKKSLIEEYVSINGHEALTSLLPKFRSKGLVLNIQTLLNI